MSFVPINDGVDHINIYSRAKTELGQLLSNFARTPFKLPDDGEFLSVEGYWYWLKTGKERDVFRYLIGLAAKNEGKDLPVVLMPEEEFRDKIRAALKAKLMQTPYLQFLLLESTLPFAHYYVFQGAKKDAGYEWIVEYWEQLREEFKRESHAEETNAT